MSASDDLLPLSLKLTCVFKKLFFLARLHSRGTTTSSGMPLPMSHLSIPATWAVGEFTSLFVVWTLYQRVPFSKYCSIHSQGQPPPPYYAETQPSFCGVTLYPASILLCLYPAYAQPAWITPGGDIIHYHERHLRQEPASVSFSHSHPQFESASLGIGFCSSTSTYCKPLVWYFLCQGHPSAMRSI